MLVTSFKGVYNIIVYLETEVQSLFETNGKRVEGVQEKINQIQTLIAHIYHGDDRSRWDKILKDSFLQLETIMKDDFIHLLLQHVLIREIAQLLRFASYDQFSAIGARAVKANLLSIQPQDAKAKFETTEGKNHNSLRNLYMFTTLRPLQLDSLNLFLNLDSPLPSVPDVPKSSGIVDESYNRQSFAGGSAILRKPPCPMFVKLCYIGRQYTVSVRYVNESIGAKIPIFRRKKSQMIPSAAMILRIPR